MQRVKINEKSFEGQPIYVGIDYHKKSWKVTIMGHEYEHKSMSRDPDADQLVSYLRQNFPGADYKAVYEAGFSGFKSQRRLQELGVDCMVIHPADVPTSEKDRQQKTDKADSRKLAKMLRSGEFEGVHVPDEELEAGRALLRQRYRLSKDLARYKNRVKSLLFQFGIKIPDRFTDSQSRSWSRNFMEWLKDLPEGSEEIRAVVGNYVETGIQTKKQLAKVTRQVRELAKKERYRKDYELLVSIPGIGLLGGMTLLTQLGDLGRFGSLDELCNYIGLVPRMHGSGEKMVTGKLTRRGRKQIKIMLIEVAWVAIRQDPAMMVRFNELKKRMNGNKAIIRIAKNLLSRVRHVIKHQTAYERGVIK
jgi:transposase